MRKTIVAFILIWTFLCGVRAQTANPSTSQTIDTNIGRHDFFYAGQSKQRRMFIVSQDEVACDAVGMDILIGEWPEYGSLNYCDEYLREAASIPFAPSGTTYKQDGKPLERSLGLFEHWNNQKERKYIKIDLKYKQM